MMEGYLGRDQATAEVLRDGWLDTGDLGFVVDGELYLSGRAKDVLILRGRNHSPVEAEHAVDRIEGVRVGCAAAVSYLPEGADSEVLVVLVEARRGEPSERFAEIAGAAARAVRSATGLEPDHVEVLEAGSLPRTSSGKIRRHEALRLWRAGELGVPSPVTAWRLAGAFIRSKLAMDRSERRRGQG